MGIMEIKLYVIRFTTPRNFDSGVFFYTREKSVILHLRIVALIVKNKNAKDFSWESVYWFVLWFRCLPGWFWKRTERSLKELRELSLSNDKMKVAIQIRTLFQTKGVLYSL